MAFLKTCTYMAAIAVVGMVLVVLGSTLEALALGVHRSATEIGSVFLGNGHSHASSHTRSFTHPFTLTLAPIVLYF